MKKILKRMEGVMLALALLVTSLPMNALDVQAAETGGRGGASTQYEAAADTLQETDVDAADGARQDINGDAAADADALDALAEEDLPDAEEAAAGSAAWLDAANAADGEAVDVSGQNAAADAEEAALDSAAWQDAANAADGEAVDVSGQNAAADAEEAAAGSAAWLDAANAADGEAVDVSGQNAEADADVSGQDAEEMECAEDVQASEASDGEAAPDMQGGEAAPMETEEADEPVSLDGAELISVTMVTVTGLDHPIAGAHPDTEVTVTTEPAEAFKSVSVKWSEIQGAKGEVINKNPSDITFEVGKKYRPYVTVTIDDKYQWNNTPYEVEGWRKGASDTVTYNELTEESGTIRFQWDGVTTTDISITGFKMPVEGEEPVWTLPKVVTTPEGAFAGVTELEWDVSTDKSGYIPMKTGDKFEAGKYYRPAFTVEQNAYCNWKTAGGGSSDGEAYTGTITADDGFSYTTTKAYFMPIDGTSYAYFFGEYMLCSLRVVSDISITGIEKPVAGATPDTTATVTVTPAGACDATVTVKWYCSDNGGWTYTEMAAGDVFAVGNTYRPIVELTLKDGYLLRTASGDGTGDYTGTVTGDERLSGYKVTQSGTTISCKGAGTQLAEVNSKGGYITWAYDVDSRTLTISGTGAMEDYTYDDRAPWKKIYNGCQKVVIESGITSIGNYAIDNFADLTSATIPDTVTAIGDFAFFSCPDLAEVTIPSGVTSIGKRAFLNSGMTELTLPAGVETIGAGAFRYSQKLEKVTLPSGIETIDEQVFENCTALEEITIPKSVTEIKQNAFNNCDALATGTVIYLGTEEDWNKITINTTGNDALMSATKTFHDKCTDLGMNAAKEPTCTEAGHRAYYECTLCGTCYADAEGAEEITDLAAWKAKGGKGYIPAHSGKEQEGKAATCTEAGYKAYYKCSVCEECFEDEDCTEEITNLDAWKAVGGKGYLAPAHSGKEQEGQAATCTAAGYKAYYQCSVCEKYFEDAACTTGITDLAAWKTSGAGYIAPPGHSYAVLKNADGHWQRCGTCGAETAAEAHSFGADDVCTVCGYEKGAVHAHNGKKVEAKASTCTAAGNQEYYECTGCGLYFKDEDCTQETTLAEVKIDATGHDFTTVKSDAAYHWYACANAGCTEIKDKQAHDFTKKMQDDTHHWSRCAKEGCFAQTEKEAHAYGADGKCTACGKDKDVKHEHKGTLVEGKEGTCLSKGTKAYYECGCGKYFEDEACTKEITDIAGYTAAAFGAHDLKETAEAAALCEKAGCRAYYGCGVCGKSFEDKDAVTEITDLKAWAAEGGKGYLAPLGHEFGDYVSDESGHFRKCTREGCTGTSAKEAHDYSVKASDNENYWKECGVCGHVTEKKPLAVYVMPLTGPVYSDGKKAVYLDLEVYCGWERLVEGADYTVKYKNNKKIYEGELPKAGETAGKDVPSATVTGKGDYMGASQQVVYFNILPVPEGMTIEVPGGAIDDAAVRVEMPKEADYAKGGVTVPVRIYFKDKLLRQGKDYTIKFKNNKVSGTADVEIKGKGAFKGSRMEHFTIRERALGGLVVVANDKATKGKTGIKTTVAVYDRNGKKLSAGKDYDKNIEFTYASDAVVLTKDGAAAKKAGDAADAKDTVSGNAVVQVKVTAKAGSGYTGSAVTTYVINENTLAKAKITFNAVEFSGKEATVSGKDVSKAALGKETLTYGTDFEIDQTSYCGNTKKGTAYVVITGKGKYAGCTKRVSFKVTAKKM